jgi:hypothetical protein
MRTARHRPAVPILVALVLAAGCAHPRAATGPVPIPDPCAGAGADTAGWTVVDTGPFRFTAPREYRQRQVQGVDSFVGRWEASRGRRVTFDWGMYSSQLRDDATHLQGFRDCAMEIGGQGVRVVSGYDAEGRWGDGTPVYVVAAAWRDVSPGTHLTLAATGADPADLTVLLSVVRSIRFNRAAPSGVPAPRR